MNTQTELPEPDFHPRSCLSAIVICIIIYALVFFSIKCSSQTFVAGLGKTSRGTGVSKFAFIKPGTIMPYARFVNEELDCPDKYGNAGPVGIEHDEFAIGIIYQLKQVPELSLFLGGGRYNEKICYNPVPMDRQVRYRKDITAEIGFNYRLLNWHWGNFMIDATLNSYSGISTVLCLGVKIRK